MARHGLVSSSDDYDSNNWDYICWRGAVASALRGKRGQSFLRDLLAAVDARLGKRESWDAACAV